MGYRIEDEPIDIQKIYAVAHEVEGSPKSWHHAVREKPDHWGFDITGTGYGGLYATVLLVFEWSIHESKRPRYTALKHFRRMIEAFATGLAEIQCVLTHDVYDIEISMESDMVYIKQYLRVTQVDTYERLRELAEREGAL